MREVDAGFSGSIAEVYDRLLVPLIFERYADDLAQRVAVRAPEAILEIAAGSGVATRAVAAVLAPGARLVVTDLNQPMLDQAASVQTEPEVIEWRAADAQDLPFDDDSFDIVICQFGVMFFPDRIAAYREAHRVLRPDGALIFSMWDRIEANEFADVVTQVAAVAFPDDPPQFLARTPHGHYDPSVYRTELTAAGFETVEVVALDKRSVAADPSIPAIAYCQGTPLRSEIEAHGSPSLVEVTDLATGALAQRFGPGPIQGRIRAFVISAR